MANAQHSFVPAYGVTVIRLVSVEDGCRRHPHDEHYADFVVGVMASGQEEGDRFGLNLWEGEGGGGNAVAPIRLDSLSQMSPKIIKSSHF